MSPRRQSQPRTRTPAARPPTELGRSVEAGAAASWARSHRAGRRPHRAAAVAGRSALPHNGVIAGRYLATVVERAAAVATALAMTVDLLAETNDD